MGLTANPQVGTGSRAELAARSQVSIACTDGNRSHDYHTSRNRRSGTLVRRFEDGHALHVRGHRKQIDHHGVPLPLKLTQRAPAAVCRRPRLIAPPPPSTVVRGMGKISPPNNAVQRQGGALDDDVILRGPLGKMAVAEAAPAGLAPADLYVGAISWWSTAVSPAVSIVSWPSAPLTVWMSHVHDDASDGSRLVDVLRRHLGGPAPLATHHNVTNGKVYSAAVHSTRRAENTGTGTSALLLTGSPFTTGPGSSWRSPLQELHTRTAWDGRHFIPTRGFRRYRAAGRTAPPYVGALWTPALRARRGFLSTDAATWSRVLHFAQRSAPAPQETVSSDSWKRGVAEAYRWAFHTRPCLTYTPPAGKMRDMIRHAEVRCDAMLLVNAPPWTAPLPTGRRFMTDPAEPRRVRVTSPR